MKVIEMKEIGYGKKISMPILRQDWHETNFTSLEEVKSSFSNIETSFIIEETDNFIAFAIFNIDKDIYGISSVVMYRGALNED